MIHVVKIGGRAQAEAGLPEALAMVAGVPGTALCVVHGGGDEVSSLQRRLGEEPRFVSGRRFTSPAELEVVRMVLSGTINKRIVRQLSAAGVPAVGISGEDGGLLPATLFQDGALGAVGAPRRAACQVLHALFAGGFVPVVSPVGTDVETGAGLNINGDDAAAAIAESLGADELYLLADVPGVFGEGNVLLPNVDLDGLASLLDQGVARDGMRAKLESARRALLGGVPLVRIGDIIGLRDRSRGTTITHSPSTV